MLFRSDEENFTLATKAKKGKGNKFHSKYESDKDGKKCDMSRVRCFQYQEHGHYATNFPQNNKNKKALRSTTSEALASKFELSFSLIACMVSSAMGSVWYLGSGASFHMKGDKELFSSSEEKDLLMHIQRAYDRRYCDTDIGRVTFDRY